MVYHKAKKKTVGMTEALLARFSYLSCLSFFSCFVRIIVKDRKHAWAFFLLSFSLHFPTIPSIKPRALLAIVAVILVMTRTRQLQQQKKTAAVLSGSLRHRRPKTKDTLEKEKRTRLLDEAIVTGDIDALRRLSVTGAGFINDGIRRRAW